ncbi:hypothetical protein Ahy_A02g007259 isoform B [Arachis hypogaea]|uniref:Uncharacterized protein n=1 Tax=Arachis hypogaea TaxID=3818 RepID=A0A445EBZ1_ARAHY|nr:hypothetical protein Ahy_A02g007259 isoform B [Arachis hypogaea]
MPEITGKCSS